VPADDQLGELAALQKQGKIRHLGAHPAGGEGPGSAPEAGRAGGGLRQRTLGK
jgi:hypothetical protein